MSTCAISLIAPGIAARAQLATTRPLSSRTSSTSGDAKVVSFKGYQRQVSRVVCNASGAKGFASSKGNNKSNKKVNLDSKKELPRGWENAGNLADFEANPKKPFISPFTGEAFMLFKFEDKVYCTEANSTAFKFPLVDAEISAGEDGPVIKVPLDGTSYNLATGEVIEWCPTDTFLRGFLGKLKEKTAPIPLKVFETKVSTDGTVIFKGLRD